ncbi:uncharacterized protein LOC101449642 [Ceratitis capitata]|uniref:(Mediterranean fruit fly) hypothetical protein n=1 Tax=Ceratitis capitata TaxID=7213 RepID=W8C506_CERCA|nr:uncharacterized protein LOC101449642 [Ceratitis capitata]XP_020715664.1 uncharacterized protein LOC101449642 [Ceratitis capitata]CAD6998377.1 unnamed protein product [Ceratitis capitata]
MRNDNVQVTSSINVPAVRFNANKDFQNRSLTYDRDIAFARHQRKSWVRPSSERRSNREALTTLLSAHGENSNDCIERLLAEEISYRDLGSLSNSDLELMGFKDSNERQELISFFTELPNQDPSFKNICDIHEAKMYNGEIMSNAIDHMENMRSALSATNYKLKIFPPDDIIVGDKSFASRFVLEALTELKTVTSEIDKELEELSKLTLDKGSIPVLKRKNKKFHYFTLGFWALACSITAATALTTVYFLKTIKN